MMEERIINAICKVHTAAYLGIIRDFVMNAHIPLEQLKHDFEQPNDDEYLTWNGVGFHILKEWDGDGNVKCHAEPGQWQATNVGRMWAKGETRLHRSLRTHGDAQ